MSCCVIIVTYNSELHINHCMECLLKQQKQPDKILIVDTGSDDLNYLEPFRKHSQVEIHTAEKNSGFCRGNNLGYKHVSDHTDYVFILNPDAFIERNFIADAIGFLNRPENQEYAAVTGTTLGFDIKTHKTTGKYDTTGIFRTWYGKWYDRGQGKKVQADLFTKTEQLAAICGAVFFCRKKALDAVLVDGHHLFDPKFYMYKEDIDLSLRLRNKGWKLAFVPHLRTYHCRGWNSDRRLMPRHLRLHSVKNELVIQLKTFNPVATLYSMTKYAGVLIFDL